MNENIIVPPPPLTLSSQIETGAGGVQTQITEKNSDKGVYCFFFATILNFLRFKRVETFIGGGGGATFYYYFFFFFFFFLGGGGGTNPYFYRNLYNCDFSGGGGGGGGGPDHLSLSRFAHG